MSRNDAEIDPLPDEPPPPYEPLGGVAPAVTTSTAQPTSAVATSTGSTGPLVTGSSTSSRTSHNPFLAPEEHSTSTAVTPSSNAETNPFASVVTPQHTSSTVTSTPAPHSTSQAPSLPPRLSAATVSPPPTPSESSAPGPTRPSIESHHSRHSSTATVPLASPSIYSPPSHAPPPTSPLASSRRNDAYRPTTVPTPGQPLLRKGKLLVYPRSWPGCPKCLDTGYKHGDPNNPHKSCWDKYGKTYTSAMSYSVGLEGGGGGSLQKPLPVVSGPSSPGGRINSHGYVPGGYPGASGGAFSPPIQQQHSQGYGGYAAPAHAPPPHHPQSNAASRPPRPPASPTVDAETEGARMSDVPPNYADASNVDSNERLPSQYVPPPMPPPGHGPPPRPPGGYPHAHAHPQPYPHPHYGPQSPPGSGFVGGFGPNPGGPNPYVSVQPQHVQQAWYGARPPPPGALVVMPGDPRIGGRLCYECGGRGMTESFWFGDETCYRCRGSGRIF